MRHVLREIGMKKALKYVWGQAQSVMIDMRLLLPPLRGVMLRAFGARIGAGVVAEYFSSINLHCTGFRGLSIGSYSYIGAETLLDLTDRIELAEDVTIAARVIVLTHHNVGHRHRHPLAQYFPRIQAPVRFQRGCFIGAGSTVLAGITVGEMSVVGAGSVVTEDVPPYAVVAGVPAKFIRKITAPKTRDA